MNQFPVSLIVAVYNRADALRLVFTAIAGQTVPPLQVLVADDGSSGAIAEEVLLAHEELGLNITHVRHDDRGWRKNRILNTAVRAADADYLVFIDGDCVPHRRFIEDHVSAASPGRVVCGRRVELSPAWTKRITQQRVLSGAYQRIGPAEIVDGLRGRAIRVEEGIRFSAPFLLRLAHGRRRGMLGSNFSLHKRDLEAINGFDEAYDGPGCGEDSDVEYRLGLAGVVPYLLRHKAIQYHLWHPRTKMSESSLRRFEAVKLRGQVFCDEGLRGPASAARPPRNMAGQST